MPYSESHARTLLREVLPRLKTILENRRYWDLTFLRIYLDYCDSVLFDNPKEGLELAEVAPQLALLIPTKSLEEWKYVGKAEKQPYRELLVRSFAVLGGAYRAVARFAEAEASYRSAARHADRGPISPIVRANLEKRLAKLRAAQGRESESVRLLDGAIASYREFGDQITYADALVTKGCVLVDLHRFSEAVPYLSQALVLAKGKRRTSKMAERIVTSATHNLAAAVVENCTPENLSAALPLVIEAKRYQGRCRNSIAKEKLTWVEARIHARFGCGRTAERRLLSARKKLFELGAPFEGALVGMELSLLYLRWHEWPKLEAMALGTFEEFKVLSSHKEATASLRLWVEGAEKRSLTRESIRMIQATIEALVVRGEK